MKTIATKAEFTALSNQGLLGNTFRSWPSLMALHESMYEGHLTIRCKDRWSKYFVPTVPPGKLTPAIKKLLRKGAKLEDLYFQEIPHFAGCHDLKCQGCGRLINGEVMAGGEIAGERSPIMVYGTSQTLNLRHDIEQNGIVVSGRDVAQTFRRLCGDEEAWNDVMAMLHEYPRSVIEFTVFSNPVGTEHRNTIFWECRNY